MTATDKEALNSNEMKDLTFAGVKALFPEMQSGPLFSPNLESGNPGIRIIANDEDLVTMLKIVYLENMELANNVGDALAECSEFLLNPDDGKENIEVKQRIEWIKYKLALYCSVKGRFTDTYKQISTNVLTNTMTEQGWKPLGIPLGRPNSQPKEFDQQKGKGRP